jgi:hypothetical protein
MICVDEDVIEAPDAVTPLTRKGESTMKKPQRPSTQQLVQRGARSNLRKAANVLAHALRLGKVPGGEEVARGDCDTPKCGVSGRRFTLSWFDRDPNLPHCGVIRNDGKKRCVLCMSRALGVVDRATAAGAL